MLGPQTTNDEVFRMACRPLVDAVLNGFNGTLMAYGQTGTGKTYTMGSMASYSKTQGFQTGACIPCTPCIPCMPCITVHTVHTVHTMRTRIAVILIVICNNAMLPLYFTFKYFYIIIIIYAMLNCRLLLLGFRCFTRTCKN